MGSSQPCTNRGRTQSSMQNIPTAVILTNPRRWATGRRTLETTVGHRVVDTGVKFWKRRGLQP